MSPRDPTSESKRPEQTSGRGEGLALLYQGILTAIVRIQSGKQSIPSDTVGLQRQMENLLKDIEREATKVGYRSQDVADTHYVVVAFLDYVVGAFVDEAIRRTEDSNRIQWAPLQAKLYSEVRAGEGVYERLKDIRSRRDSLDLAEVLEVYNLCFLLGFEGKYALGGRSELERLMEDLGEQIERIRGRQSELSPEVEFPEAPKIARPAAAEDDRWKRIAVVLVAVAFVSWILLKLILSAYTEGAVRDMLSL